MAAFGRRYWPMAMRGAAVREVSVVTPRACRRAANASREGRPKMDAAETDKRVGRAGRARCSERCPLWERGRSQELSSATKCARSGWDRDAGPRCNGGSACDRARRVRAPSPQRSRVRWDVRCRMARERGRRRAPRKRYRRADWSDPSPRTSERLRGSCLPWETKKTAESWSGTA